MNRHSVAVRLSASSGSGLLSTPAVWRSPRQGGLHCLEDWAAPKEAADQQPVGRQPQWLKRSSSGIARCTQYRVPSHSSAWKLMELRRRAQGSSVGEVVAQCEPPGGGGTDGGNRGTDADWARWGLAQPRLIAAGSRDGTRCALYWRPPPVPGGTAVTPLQRCTSAPTAMSKKRRRKR